MRLVLGGIAGALSLVLAGCDIGGGSSDPDPTPTPTPTATTTPTPTPTTSPSPVTYTTSEAALQYTTEGGVQRVANTRSVAPAMGTVFSYTPDLGGYSYVLLNGTVSPSASETAILPVSSFKACDVSPLCFGNGFAFQQVPAGAGFYYLSRLVTGPGNPVQVLNTTGYGLFVESLIEGTPASRLQVDLRPFAYGISSPSGAIPTTGTATFNGFVVGHATGDKPGTTGTSNVYKMTGALQLVVNYETGNATLKLTLAGDATGCTTASCAADLNLTYDSTAGTLASGVITFTLPGSGSARFFLAGGTAPATGVTAVAPLEVGGSFSLRAADPNEAAVTMVITGSGGGSR